MSDFFRVGMFIQFHQKELCGKRFCCLFFGSLHLKSCWLHQPRQMFFWAQPSHWICDLCTVRKSPKSMGISHGKNSDVKEKDLVNLWAVLGQVDFGVEVWWLVMTLSVLVFFWKLQSFASLKKERERRTFLFTILLLPILVQRDTPLKTNMNTILMMVWKGAWSNLRFLSGLHDPKRRTMHPKR